MKNDLISVIVPVYKVENYLDICVESIVRQTHRNLEIILVDDGSPDRCPQMCDEWAKRDSRIKVIHQKNAGASAARNAALEIAKGDYFGFVDSDDYIAEDMYALLLDELITSNYLMSSCFPARVMGNSIENCKDENPVSYDSVEAMICFFEGKKVSSAVWDKLFVRSLFDDIRFPEGETNEEYPIFIPLIMKAGGIRVTGKQKYFYRGTEGSVTASSWKTDAGIVLKHFSEMEEQINQYGLERTKPAFRMFCASGAFSLALQLDKNEYRISEAAKENRDRYVCIMRKNFWHVQSSSLFSLKDKILYILIVMRIFIPVLKIIGKYHE